MSTAIYHKVIRAIKALLTDSAYYWIVSLLVLISDVILTQLIIRFVSYTEIDWETYMVQVEVFLKGEHNYSRITGPTGPLVYPAGHVRIYQLLHSLTDSGRNLRYAQQIFAALYAGSLGLSCIIYGQAGGHPNWILLFLALSKRLHSIFILRLFNDTWAVVASQAAVLMYQRGSDDIATVLFSAAISIKMSVLLYLPGILVILFRRRGLLSTFRHIITIILLQILVALPFLFEDAQAYVNAAFDLRRVFLYKWTVNWKFIPEDIFLNPYWAVGLLFTHLSVLFVFCIFRWLKVEGGTWAVLRRGLARPYFPSSKVAVTSDDVATILFTSNIIGITFARSLHYQFYSWYAYQLPFLAWRTPYSLAFKLALLLAIEYSWNVFPATFLSSLILFCANCLLLLGVWNTKNARDNKAKNM